MKIQNRNNVLHRTSHSFDALFSDCSNLMEELEAKEIEVYSEEKYYEAFILQFSFIEWKIEEITKHYAAKLGINPSSMKMLTDENSVNRKISYYDFILSSFISDKSKNDFQQLINKLRDYNSFRNDFLHDCSNPNKFKNAMHIDQSLVEAYGEGLQIIKLLSLIKLKKRIAK